MDPYDDMDPNDGEEIPLLPLSVGEAPIYTMKYTPQEREIIKNSRVAELSTYLKDSSVYVPVETRDLQLKGKQLLYKNKPLTKYDGQFKSADEIASILMYVDESMLSKTPTTGGLKEQMLKHQVKQLYKHMNYEDEILDVHLDRFELKEGVLYYLKNGKEYNLTNKKNGGFRTPGEINKIITDLHRRELGLSPIVKQLDKAVPTEREVEHIPLQDLGKTVDEVNKVIGDPKDLPLPMREILGLDKALQRISGEIVNGTGKLTEIEQRIANQQKKLKEPNITEQQKKRVNDRISDLKEEHKVRLESLSHVKEELSSQFARIRQTLDKVADGDRTLKERLKLLWREQGLTLVSVLTAVGMTVATLVLALLPGGAAGAAAGGGGKNPRDWVKKSLASLARLFGKLGKWALSALPGAIGSIISAIFNLLKTVVTKAAEYTYATIGAGVALITYLLFKK